MSQLSKNLEDKMSELTAQLNQNRARRDELEGEIRRDEALLKSCQDLYRAETGLNYVVAQVSLPYESLHRVSAKASLPVESLQGVASPPDAHIDEAAPKKARA